MMSAASYAVWAWSEHRVGPLSAPDTQGAAGLPEALHGYTTEKHAELDGRVVPALITAAVRGCHGC